MPSNPLPRSDKPTSQYGIQGQSTTKLRRSLNVAKLASWMAADIPLHMALANEPVYHLLTSGQEGIVKEMDIRQFGLGQSNPTYLLSFPNFDFTAVLRKKPDKVAHVSAHALHREFRVLKALQRHNELNPEEYVPVPVVYSYCKDNQVLGAEFYVMEFVAGRIFSDASMPGVTKSERHDAIADMIRVLACIHKVDILQVGLQDFGQRGKFVHRQIQRLSEVSKQQSQISGTPAPEIERLAKQLTEYAPYCPDRFGLLHGANTVLACASLL